jgi:predicted MPP superfamily phosphohydrolase
MTINEIAWLTDIHLNFLESEARKKFYQKLSDSNTDAILITGDIAEATDICELLIELNNSVDKDIYFVLGNHDYYLGSVIEVRQAIQNLCKQNKKLYWLGEPEIVKLNKDTVLVGQDGWADARYGDFDHSNIALNDSRYIAELFQASCMGRGKLKYEMQKLADTDAAILQETLEKSLAKNDIRKVIIATHVPPFKECCRYKGKPSDENWQPYFSSKATGDVITAIAKNHPAVKFLVLCGHTHTKYTIKPFDNLEVRVGGAEYYRPKLQEVIEI